MEDFDEEDVDDLDIEETMDDSFAAPGINTTAGLVGAMHQEQGIVRAARSPSPEGSASDFSEGESSSSGNVTRKSKTGLRKVDKSRVEKSKVSDFGEIALKALVEIAKNGKSKSKSKSDSEDSDCAQEPVMVKFDNYKVRDDGHGKLDMKLRNALRTINAKPRKYFKNLSRRVKPVLETLENEHLTSTLINPKVMKKIHDRGSYLELRYFDANNISVETRAPKASFSSASGNVVGTLSHDWAEPQTIWACVDAVINYCISVYGVRQEDYSPWVLMKTLHEMRYFAICKSASQQKKVLTDFVNNFFRKNEVAGRKKESPLDIKSAMDVANASLIKAGIHPMNTNILGVEPYSGSRQSDMEEKDQEVKKLRIEVSNDY